MLHHKGIAIKLLTAAFLLASVRTAIAQDRIVSEHELPKTIREYVRKHFPEHKILQSVEDKELFSRNYELTLEGNIQLEFDAKDQIKDIDGRTKLPDHVLPEKIRQYVAAHYPDQTITDWERDDKKQQVGLDNGLDLEFTLKGDFLRIDD